MKCLWVAALSSVLGCAPPPPREPPPAAARPKPNDAEAGAERVAGDILGEMLEGVHGPYADRSLQSYVDRVGRRVARVASRPEIDWRFHITDDREVDARALPGGRIVISRAALACLGSEAELGAVLAHEVAHVTLDHASVRKRALPARDDPESGELEQLLDADEERQADALAVRYLRQAGYDPRAVGRALDALRRSVVFECRQETERRDCDSLRDPSDPHPAWPTRLARVALVAGTAGGEEGRDRYLSHIDGLVFGEGREAPRFVHGRFEAGGGPSIALPKGANAELSGAVLTSTGLGPSIVIVRAHGPLWKRMLLEALQKSTHSVREISGWHTVVGSFGDQSGASAHAALLDAAPFIYLIAVAGGSDGSRELLEQLLASVRPASPVKPRVRVLRIARARRPTTLGKLCPNTSARLADALNPMREDRAVSAGTRVKCIEGEP